LFEKPQDGNLKVARISKGWLRKVIRRTCCITGALFFEEGGLVMSILRTLALIACITFVTALVSQNANAEQVSAVLFK